MSSWSECPMLALDFESTGINALEVRAVQVALCRIRPGKGAEQRTWLINPGIPIPPEASDIHGITDAIAFEHGKQPLQVFTEVRAAVVDWLKQGLPLVAFNASYDITLLESELERWGLGTITAELGQIAPVIDPYVIDKHIDPYRKGSRKLVDQCTHYKVPHGGAHDACEDAMAAARLAWRIGQSFTQIGRLPLAELHAAQIEWAAGQASSFRQYLQKQGKPCDDVTGEWPLRVAA